MSRGTFMGILRGMGSIDFRVGVGRGVAWAR
jgi:hypothetical protein